MADSDGEYNPDPDEEMALDDLADDPRGIGGSSRPQRGGREKQAWEGRIQDRVGGLIREGSDGRITGSVKEAEEARKRKR